MPNAFTICCTLRPSSLPAAAAAPETPIAAVRCQPRSSVEASATGQEISSSNTAASIRLCPVTPPSMSETARLAARPGCARMDRASAIERIVEIQCMSHAGIHQGSLRRQPPPPQHHLTFLNAAPFSEDMSEFGIAGRTAAAEEATKGIKNVMAGCDARRFRQRVKADATHAPPAPRLDPSSWWRSPSVEVVCICLGSLRRGELGSDNMPKGKFECATCSARVSRRLIHPTKIAAAHGHADGDGRDRQARARVAEYLANAAQEGNP